jgi:hypothetical protein
MLFTEGPLGWEQMKSSGSLCRAAGLTVCLRLLRLSFAGARWIAWGSNPSSTGLPAREIQNDKIEIRYSMQVPYTETVFYNNLVPLSLFAHVMSLMKHSACWSIDDQWPNNWDFHYHTITPSHCCNQSCTPLLARSRCSNGAFGAVWLGPPEWLSVEGQRVHEVRGTLLGKASWWQPRAFGHPIQYWAIDGLMEKGRAYQQRGHPIQYWAIDGLMEKGRAYQQRGMRVGSRE